MRLWMRKLLIVLATFAALVAGSYLCHYLGLGTGLSALWGVFCGFLGADRWMDISLDAELERHVVKEQG